MTALPIIEVAKRLLANVDAERGDFTADFNNDARGFMSENHRRFDDKRPNSAMLIIMNVRPANSDCFDSDAHIVRPQSFGNGKFAQPQLLCFF